MWATYSSLNWGLCPRVPVRRRQLYQLYKQRESNRRVGNLGLDKWQVKNEDLEIMEVMMQEAAATPGLGKPKEQAGLLKTQKTGGGPRSLGVGLPGGCGLARWALKEGRLRAWFCKVKQRLTHCCCWDGASHRKLEGAAAPVLGSVAELMLTRTGKENQKLTMSPSSCSLAKSLVPAMGRA